MSAGMGDPLGSPVLPTPGPPDRWSSTRFCIAVGLTLGIVATFGGFVALVIVVLFGLVGLLVGRVLDGRLDLAALLGRFSSK